MQETNSERRKRKLRRLAISAGRADLAETAPKSDPDEPTAQRRGLAVIAEKAGVNPASLDQILKGVRLEKRADGTEGPPRSLGDKAARKIEQALELGEGWFDSPEFEPALSAEAMALALSYERMTDTERQRLRLLMLASRDGVNPTNIRTAPHAAPDDKGGDSWFDKLDTPETRKHEDDNKKQGSQ